MSLFASPLLGVFSLPSNSLRGYALVSCQHFSEPWHRKQNSTRHSTFSMQVAKQATSQKGMDQMISCSLPNIRNYQHESTSINWSNSIMHSEMTCRAGEDVRQLCRLMRASLSTWCQLLWLLWIGLALGRFLTRLLIGVQCPPSFIQNERNFEVQISCISCIQRLRTYTTTWRTT